MVDPASASDDRVELVRLAEELSRTDVRRCLELVDDALQRADVRADPVAVAGLHSARSDVHLLTGDTAAAFASAQAAKIAWLSVGRPVEARMAGLGHAAALLLTGWYADAAELARRALIGLEAEAGTFDAVADGIHLQANLQLGFCAMAVGDVQRGNRHLGLAEELARGTGDTFVIAEVDLVRGCALLSLGMVFRAIDKLCEARSGFLEVGAEPWAAICVVPLAQALASSGRTVQALEILEIVRPQLVELGLQVADHDLATAFVMLSAGLTSEALAAATAARDSFRDRGATSGCARAELAMAQCLARMGRIPDAERALAAAQALGSDTGEQQLVEEARLFGAALALEQGDLETVRAMGAALLADVPSRVGRVRAKLLIARATDDDVAALELIDAAAHKVDRTGRPELRRALRVERARHLARMGDRAGAIEELRVAVAQPSTVASAPGASGTSRSAPGVDDLIGLLIEDGTHTATIEAWQRVQHVKHAAAAVLADESEDWSVEPAEAASVDALIERARRSGQGRSATARAGSVVTTLPAEPVVEFYVLGDDVVVFVIRDGLVHAHVIKDGHAASARLANAWRHECVLIAAVGPRPGATTSDTLDAAFDLLIAPVADWLTDLDGAAVSVAGHRHLNVLPIEAMLEVGAGWRTRLGGEIWPDEPADVALAIPARTLVLAVPDDHAPEIAAEAEMIAAAMPEAEVHIGAGATSAVLAARAPDVDVVHISAHGRFRSGNPLSSAVRLGDGWLRATDLVRGAVDLDGRVVVLSACVSGVGSERMEAPVGLVWACHTAGAVGVIAALWPVDDKTTLLLMEHFYGLLALGHHPRPALAQAQRAVAALHPHPFYWAAFQYFDRPV